MNVKTLGLVTIVSFALSAPVAFAGDYSSDMEKDAMKSDRGTMHEGQRMGEQSFDQLDANRDGFITEDELNVWGSTAAGDPRTDPMPSDEARDLMMDRDADSDGRLTPDEFEESM